jgi:hypothetical protein
MNLRRLSGMGTSFVLVGFSRDGWKNTMHALGPARADWLDRHFQYNPRLDPVVAKRSRVRSEDSLRRFITLAVIALSVACTKTETTTRTETPTPSTETTASSAPAPAPATRNVCELLTAEELKTATGIEGTGSPSKSGDADVCSWFGGGGAAILQVYGSASSYESSRSAFEGLYEGKTAELPGVGDKAFFIEGETSRMPTTTISAAKGSNAISVQIMGGTDAAARKTAATELAKVALTKL